MVWLRVDTNNGAKAKNCNEKSKQEAKDEESEICDEAIDNDAQAEPHSNL